MRNRFLFVSGLIALVLAAGMAPAASAGTPVPQDYACGSGNFLVGFQGHLGVWIDQFQPICAHWDVTHQTFGPEQPGPTFGNIHGGSVDLSRAVCAPGEAVAKIAYGWAVPNGPPGHVQALAVTCAPMATAQPNNNSISLGNQPGSSKFASYPCPGAQVAAGLTIYLDGVNISDLYPACQNPPASPPPPVATAPPPAAPRPVISHLGHPKPPSSAPVQGSWFYSCSKASLYGNVLSASCKTTTGLEVATSLDLTTCNQPATAANINGKLVCESGVAPPGGAAPTPAPAPAPGPVTAVSPSDVIEGDWKTSEGSMTFTQQGKRHLDGTYAQDSGRIRAEREQGHWMGFWSESKSDHKCNNPRLGSDYWGRMDFVFTDGNRHFEGMWSYCDALPQSGAKWTGDRVK